ncbi:MULTISPECIES: NADH:flavin oxidoreductase/NADH oxidase [unclassified Rathayibacter]|uniref:NADH:flavin oxidoreductase/NADH oxidase n=1 Tax=unclassified Rathayibacter TaxID=2609250 RepID=UPI00188DACA3|nr:MULTISPECIES: NADH:flavin oxidoreductase/NADH oxidase [unclassified Rathayibacter]MBF4463217.1 NADH:flavin oxidoreductase/NADH oxidase [Rathayibacter sp. VKM Ac-2879]MBF4504546.1 NADH:flavin oxidoreductase/NADH oxidase [Rathayibacter sp. VKM Ac-2878]
MTTSALFQPLTLRSRTARNRLWAAPMCQYSVEQQDGVPATWHLVHLGSLARGGVGVVIAEATAVVPEGRISPWDTGLWTDEQRDAWVPIVDFVHAQGALAGVQLAHAGRKASTYREWSGRGSVPPSAGGWEAVAPSAVAFDGYATPRALGAEELPSVVEAFRASARRAVEAGFDVIEIHAAHGYLLHQFLSPLSNHRDDDFGGSLENRARLLLDVVRAVRAEIADLPLLVRFSATDWAKGGWTLEETIQVSEWARAEGVDLFDVSTGGLVGGTSIPVAPLYQVPFARDLKRATGALVGAVGLITTAEQAEGVVSAGDADVVLLARELLRDPNATVRMAHELGAPAHLVPPQYARAWH